MPQIIMLGHAGHCNYERIKSKDEPKESDGSFLDKMTEEERDRYYSRW